MQGRITLIFFSLLLFSGSLSAECSYQSPSHRVALLELYTSEGCSSCPPADRWLSGLAGQGLRADQVVPLSLHVDYWNYIGWRDPYSDPRYTQRQRKIARNNRLSTIYTPQLVLQGRDFRAWRRMNFPRLLAELNRAPARADIELRIAPRAQRQFEIAVTASLHAGNSGHLYVAIYENRLSSTVTAGENDGRVLQHDYVVRKLFGPIQAGAGPDKRLQFQQQLSLAREWRADRLGAAVFVEQPNGEILQAMAKPLQCGG